MKIPLQNQHKFYVTLQTVSQNPCHLLYGNGVEIEFKKKNFLLSLEESEAPQYPATETDDALKIEVRNSKENEAKKKKKKNGNGKRERRGKERIIILGREKKIRGLSETREKSKRI